MKILIVDDHAVIRTGLRQLCADTGAVVVEADSGTAALAQQKSERPQLTVLDLNMPQLGGHEVLRQIQEERPDLPVIVVSSQSAMKTVQEVAQLGAIGYVLKHASKNEALRALREALATLENESSA